MADNGQDSEGYRGSPQPERTSEEQDKQALLLKLPERTVLQAEALAQEITHRLENRAKRKTPRSAITTWQKPRKKPEK